LNLLAAANTIHDMNFNCVRWLSQLVARLIMLFGAVWTSSLSDQRV